MSSNGTIVIPDRPSDAGDLLRNILEMLVPILLTAVIIALILFRVDVTHRFEQTATTVQTTSCVAVKESNDSTYRLWASQIKANPDSTSTPAKRAQVDAFLTALRANDKAIYDKCLAGEGEPSTRAK